MVHNSATENALALNSAKCKALIISPSKNKFLQHPHASLLTNRIHGILVVVGPFSHHARVLTTKLGGPTYFAYELSRES